MTKLKITAGSTNHVLNTYIDPFATDLEGNNAWELKISSNGQSPEKFIFNEEQLRSLGTKINRIFNI